MKFDEKIKNKYLYKKGYNIFKLLYFFYQYLKSKKILKQKIFYSNWIGSQYWIIRRKICKTDSQCVDVHKMVFAGAI